MYILVLQQIRLKTEYFSNIHTHASTVLDTNNDPYLSKTGITVPVIPWEYIKESQ